MEAGLFPPMAANVLLILVGAISMVALVGIAYTYSIAASNRRQIARIEDIEHTIKVLQQDIRDLQRKMGEDRKGEGRQADESSAKVRPNSPIADTGRGNLKQEIWQGFVDDYNNLANSMNVPKAEEACDNFVHNNRVKLLICITRQEEGERTPVYEMVNSVGDSKYWAWNLPGQPEDFIVVPNPLQEYDEELHHQGGMKETFASNYETGRFKQVQVKLPAHFTLRQGKWKIIQPGVIRVK
ncbi:MAG: hypothetical protein K6F95_10305 [Selenomonas sp.]|uniref:hypothetical protein n=1 Tax=Selenomonas sp. TaxID=2053611 RepID=UPI0025F1A4B0|nr:hypothetical protein [Selenomonas sp.]MCR5758281.1 hypothetical protein [Selenomonas sp.]